jgi:hypothetical protein
VCVCFLNGARRGKREVSAGRSDDDDDDDGRRRETTTTGDDDDDDDGRRVGRELGRRGIDDGETRIGR